MKRRLFVPLLLAAVAGGIAGALVSGGSAQSAEPPKPVQEVNTDGNGDIKVAQQGTVTTLAAVAPANAFSLTGRGFAVTEGCGKGLPAGTTWYLSSFGVANDGDGFTSAILQLVGQDVDRFHIVTGPTITVTAGETEQLTFPQPYALTSDFPGECLRVGFHAGTTDPADLAITLVGYRP